MEVYNCKQNVMRFFMVFLLFILCFPLTLNADEFKYQGMMFVGWYHKSFQNTWGWNADFGFSARTFHNGSGSSLERPGGWVKAIDSMTGDGESGDKGHPTKLNYVGVEVCWSQAGQTSNDMSRQVDGSGWKTAPDEFAGGVGQYNPASGSGLIAVIDYIHSKGLNVMLYPMVRLGGTTWSDLQPSNPDLWFTNFRDKILFNYADILINHYVEGDIFCVGQEFKWLTNDANGQTAKWETLIDEVRARFTAAGLDVPLIYGANWDNYDNIEFWDKLDYAGISAYFPLKDGDSPTQGEIEAAWTNSNVPGYVGENWVAQLETFHNTTNNRDGDPISIIFTEIGYASKKEAAKKPNEGAWSGNTGGKGSNQGNSNEDAYGSGNVYEVMYSYWGGASSDQDVNDYNGDLQRRCYEAAMNVFMDYADGTSGDWFRGFFWWHWQTWREGGNWKNAYIPTGDWIPSEATTEALYNITYTPQYKPAHLKYGTDSGQYTLAIGYNDTPKPVLTNPPPLLVVGKDVPYDFTFKADDADGDQVRYEVDWGDGATYGPTAFGNSGWLDTQSHSWSTIGITTITITATDKSGNGPNYTAAPGNGSTTWNDNDTGEKKIYIDVRPLPTVSNMEFSHQVNDVAPGWPPLTWVTLDVANGDHSICNDEEVKLKTTFTDVLSGDTITWVRYYYEANASTQIVTTYYDVLNDTGTSYYVSVPTTPVEVVGTDVKYESVFPVDLSGAGSYINVQAFAKVERQSVTTYVNSSENYYVVNSTGTLGTGKATSGNRDYYVLTGRGTMDEPYPLQWNVIDVSFSTSTAANYSPLRHANREPGSAPATLEVGSTQYYYFMPGSKAPNDPLYDVCNIITDHFTDRGGGGDGYGDLFINESPIMYLRASSSDLSTNSSLEYNADNTPGPWSVANSVSLSTFTALNIREDINPTTGTDAENKMGYSLGYYFLQPVNYSLMMNNLAEGTTVYYYFKARDIDPVPAGLPDTQFWKKKLDPLGVKQDTDVINNFYSFSILQDDRTPPYILASGGQTHAMRAISPALETSSLQDWITGTYTITAQINDLSDGTGSYSPNDFLFSSNIISGRGADSAVYHNVANPAFGTSSPYNPVHDTRVYYIISSSSPAVMASVTGGAYDAADQYFTGSAINVIEDDTPTRATSAFFGNSWDFGDADQDGFGYVQMINTGGNVWASIVPLPGIYISGGPYHLYYRIWTCNSDVDSQAYITPSHNRIKSDGDPSFGLNDNGAWRRNEHGTIGDPWNDPHDNATARDSDRDHGWGMWTRYGGTVQLQSPPMIKITSEVTISGTKRKVITYLDTSGNEVGKVISTEIK